VKAALVVDDSRTTRFVVASFLRELGFDAAGASDGEEALSHLEQRPDIVLIVVDWNMPVLDGLGFVAKVRADQRFAQCRILMVTAETSRARVAEALDAGVDELIMKPFTRVMFAEKLALLGVVGTP